MTVLLVVGVAIVYWSEAQPNPAFALSRVNSAATDFQAGGNMEGKEARFGIASSALFATVTTDAGGAVNGMHDSFMPLGGLVLISNLLLGEVSFGGVGSGLYGMLAYAIIAMFVAGLMVGRTPEYLGKKLEAREVKMTMLALLSYSLSILGWTALASALPQGVAGIANNGPHGFSEILYAYASATGTNGSSFAGLSTNTPFYNLTLAAAMMMGRFMYVIPLLAVAGSLAQKKRLEPSAGTLPTQNPLFVGLLVGVVIIIGGLTYFPVLSLGPVAEQGAMSQGVNYPGP
jgi:K+-transporting ATPase ATPase A chain